MLRINEQGQFVGRWSEENDKICDICDTLENERRLDDDMKLKYEINEIS